MQLRHGFILSCWNAVYMSKIYMKKIPRGEGARGKDLDKELDLFGWVWNLAKSYFSVLVNF